MDSVEYAQSFIARKATLEDTSTVIRILEEGASWLYSRGIHNQWRPGVFMALVPEIQEEINKGYVNIFEKNKDAIATMTLRDTDDVIWEDSNEDALYIHRFTIKDKYRGNALGKKFIKWAEDEADKQNKSHLRINCVAANNRLNEYCKKNGFECVGKVELGKGTTNLYEKKI